MQFNFHLTLELIMNLSNFISPVTVSVATHSEYFGSSLPFYKDIKTFCVEREDLDAVLRSIRKYAKRSNQRLVADCYGYEEQRSFLEVFNEPLSLYEESCLENSCFEPEESLSSYLENINREPEDHLSKIDFEELDREMNLPVEELEALRQQRDALSEELPF